MPFIIYCSCYPQVCYPKLLDKMRCNCEISYQGISSAERNHLQTGRIVSNTFQDESRLFILNEFSSCISFDNRNFAYIPFCTNICTLSYLTGIVISVKIFSLKFSTYMAKLSKNPKRVIGRFLND